jgi:hypothetical protein
MSASRIANSLHLRRHRLKKRSKLKARIAAAPLVERAALEARVLRTYSAFHVVVAPKPPAAAV